MTTKTAHQVVSCFGIDLTWWPRGEY